jgi:hypothetical protein
MTDILAGGIPAESRFAGHMAETERHLRSFLLTATRYLASGREQLGLQRLEAEKLDVRSMTADEFDRALIGLWKNSGK